MNILMGVEIFKNLTGAELYVYTLGKWLVKLGHNVMIAGGRVGGIIETKALECGIKVTSLADKDLISLCDKNSINSFKPDVLHLHEYIPSFLLLSRFNTIPAVATVHSEYLYGTPYISERIKKYICIRESIIEKVVKIDKIPREKCVHISNGFDTDRFNTNFTPPNNEKKIGLFIGTVDPLRKDSILHFINICEQSDMVPQIIGLKQPGCNYLNDYKNWIQPDPEIGGIWNIEDYIKKCDITAGILLGRTTIEGWLCGKCGLIYDIDLYGRIKSIKYHPVPVDVEKYSMKYVVKQINKLYEEIII